MENDEKKAGDDANAKRDPLGADAHAHASPAADAPPDTQRDASAIIGKSAPAVPRFQGSKGDHAFVVTTRTHDGTTVRALTYVEVVGVEGGRYRVNLGRGLTTLCGAEHLEVVPAEGIGGKKVFVVGEVVEIARPT